MPTILSNSKGHFVESDVYIQYSETGLKSLLLLDYR